MATVKRKNRADAPATEPNEARFAWGPSLFGSHRDDEVDGVKVGGLRLVRGDDGDLYAVPDTHDDPPEAA